MTAQLPAWLRGFARRLRRRRPPGYSVIVWRERTSGRRATMYSAGVPEGALMRDGALVSTPALFLGGDPDTWEPSQRWDQDSRSFVDISFEFAAGSSK